MYTYNTLKEAAKNQGLSINDLCALAPKNDPFYVGRPAEETAAHWFADLWRSLGFAGSTTTHLRRMHYRIVSQQTPVTLPTTLTTTDKATKETITFTHYENHDRCWDFLNEAGKWARYLQYVPAAAFVDKRNPDAIVNARYTKPGEWGFRDPAPALDMIHGWDDYGFDLPDLPELPTLPGSLPNRPDFEVNGYSSIQQPYHIEIWAEKTTMNDVLTPLCRRYSVNLITGAGELSITAVVEFMKRVREAERPARILYISDFDPAGMGMPVSIARKIEYFQRNEGYSDLDIRLQPIVLTADQISRYTLPRIPVKDSDMRKANFEAAHGQGQVELDALEALYPGELRRIVERHIKEYFDVTLVERANQVKQSLIDSMEELQRAVLADFGPELDDLESDYERLLEQFEETRQEFARLIEDFQPQISAHHARLERIKEQGRELYALILRRLEEEKESVDLKNYPLPDPDLPEESDSLLYDSSRDYLEQLAAYKAHKNGNGRE